MRFFGEEVKKRTEGFHTWYNVEVQRDIHQCYLNEWADLYEFVKENCYEDHSVEILFNSQSSMASDLSLSWREQANDIHEMAMYYCDRRTGISMYEEIQVGSKFRDTPRDMFRLCVRKTPGESTAIVCKNLEIPIKMDVKE